MILTKMHKVAIVDIYLTENQVSILNMVNTLFILGIFKSEHIMLVQTVTPIKFSCLKSRHESYMIRILTSTDLLQRWINIYQDKERIIIKWKFDKSLTSYQCTNYVQLELFSNYEHTF